MMYANSQDKGENEICNSKDCTLSLCKAENKNICICTDTDLHRKALEE
jgi:hypothetical protein